MSRAQWGSVRKLPSGRYQARYHVESKRFTSPSTFSSVADARAWLAVQQADLVRGNWIDPAAGKRTVTSVADEWLEGDPSKRRRSTVRDRGILDRHIIPDLGDAAISAVSKAAVQRLVNGWVAIGLAPSTVHRQFATLRALFTFAEDNDLRGRSPCRGVKLPQVSPSHRRIVTPEAVARLVEAVGADYEAMVWVGAVLGLRWGEVAGLRVRDIDIFGRAVSVELQLDDQGELVEVKSAAGRRRLSMPKALAEVLSLHLARRRLTAGDGDALVFAAPGGGPLSYSNWRRRVWLPAVLLAGLDDVDYRPLRATANGDIPTVPDVRFHDLRKAAATALVRDRVDLKTAQTRLGHSDVRLTLEVYAQASTDADRDAADKLGERFFGAAKGQ